MILLFPVIYPMLKIFRLLKIDNSFSRFLAKSTFYNKLTTDYEICIRSKIVEEELHKQCRVSKTDDSLNIGQFIVT